MNSTEGFGTAPSRSAAAHSLQFRRPNSAFPEKAHSLLSPWRIQPGHCRTFATDFVFGVTIFQDETSHVTRKAPNLSNDGLVITKRTH